MRNIFAIAGHDLRLTFTDRGAVMWMILLPIVFAGFFGLVMGGESGPPGSTATLTVFDEDGGILALALIEDLEGEGVAVRELTTEEYASAENLVRTLVIPSGFSNGIVAGEQQTLRLEKQPDTSQEAALVAQARIFAAATRVIGRLVKAATALEEGAKLLPEAVAAIEVSEDMVTVESTFAGTSTVTPSGFAQSIPGNAVMFVLLIALTYGAASISGERASGNLRRLITAPVDRHEIVVGKIVGRFFISASQITVLVLVGVIANLTLGIFIGDHPFQVWIVLLVFAAVVAPLGVAIGGWITDPDRAASIGVILTMVMAAFGGCWWPIEVVSKPLKNLALIFPTGWAMSTLHGLISFGHSLNEMGTNLAALAGFGIVFAILASRSLRVD